MGGGYGGRGSMEEVRVDAVSLGLAINVAKFSAMSWIAFNFSYPRVEQGVTREVVVVRR